MWDVFSKWVLVCRDIDLQSSMRVMKEDVRVQGRPIILNRKLAHRVIEGKDNTQGAETETSLSLLAVPPWTQGARPKNTNPS